MGVFTFLEHTLTGSSRFSHIAWRKKFTEKSNRLLQTHTPPEVCVQKAVVRLDDHDFSALFCLPYLTLPNTFLRTRTSGREREEETRRSARVRPGSPRARSVPGASSRPAAAALAAEVSIPAAALPAGIAPRIPFPTRSPVWRKSSSCPERANKMGKCATD